MRPDQRVVVSLPFTELWDSVGPVAARRGRRLGGADILELLHAEGGVQFVVAGVGEGPPRWVPAADAHRFWKAGVQPRIVPADAIRFDYDAYPGGYCYVATEWLLDRPGVARLVLLESHH